MILFDEPFRTFRISDIKPLNYNEHIKREALKEMVHRLQTLRRVNYRKGLGYKIPYLRQRLASFTPQELLGAITWAEMGRKQTRVPFETALAETKEYLKTHDPITVIQDMGPDFELHLIEGLKWLKPTEWKPDHIEGDAETARTTAWEITRAERKFGGLVNQFEYEYELQERRRGNVLPARKEARL